MADASKGARHFVKTAVAIGLIAPVLVFVGAAGTKLGIWDWKTGFGTLTVQWAPTAAVVGLITGGLAVLFALFASRKLLPLAIAAVLVPGATMGAFAFVRSQASAIPPIHDVSTDWDDPIRLSDSLLAERGPEANPVLDAPTAPDRAPWAGKTVAALNAEHCPGARPIPRSVDSDRVAEVLEDMGLVVYGRAPWRVEATAESFWYGFKDDVVVRIRPDRTDVRSISRVGVSDLGANCKRVTEILQRLQ